MLHKSFTIKSIPIYHNSLWELQNALKCWKVKINAWISMIFKFICFIFKILKSTPLSHNRSIFYINIITFTEELELLRIGYWTVQGHKTNKDKKMRFISCAEIPEGDGSEYREFFFRRILFVYNIFFIKKHWEEGLVYFENLYILYVLNMI